MLVVTSSSSARKQAAVSEARQAEKPAPTQERTATQPQKQTGPSQHAATPPAHAAEPSVRAAEAAADLDAQILRAAEELGYDAAKVRKWVNQKYEVTGGLGSLTPHDKREVLKIFQEQAARPQPKAARK